MKYGWMVLLMTGLIGMTGCNMMPKKNTFGRDVAFLKEHVDVLVLSDSSGQGKLAVVPAYQGRAMTSTAAGDEGISFGWLNREHIASGTFVEHINVFGGEDRFWLGPEGGQFSIFFKQGDPFDLEHWQTPAAIDTEPYELVEHSDKTARFRKDIELVNYSNTTFKLRVDREIRMLDRPQVIWRLGINPDPELAMVAFETVNTVTNTGEQPWTKDKGLLSIWILGMFNPSPQTTIVVPYVPGSESELGPVVNDAYFGKVPPDRLVIDDEVIFFRGDGCYRSKIGLDPRRARSVLGSYDARNHVLTIVQYNKPAGVRDYVNSMWELQDEPYRGDVVNSYNDGPAEPGAKPLGPFYELETSSPAAALTPGASITHIHRTIHFQGSEDQLDPIARAVLGVSLDEIKNAFD